MTKGECKALSGCRGTRLDAEGLGRAVDLGLAALPPPQEHTCMLYILS